MANGIMLYDDYAHHPTEVISTLEGLYKSFTKHRIITIFPTTSLFTTYQFIQGIFNFI